MSVCNASKLSQLFKPITSTRPNAKKDIISKSYDNLLKYGIMKQINTGMYALLPLGLRVMNKLANLVENEMKRIGAQKIQLPALTSSHLWKKTNRLESNKTELFIVKDRHKKEYILSPTYEETICNLISSTGVLSPKLLPLKLYQISSKWRNEMKPRLGFLRSNEFIMKDLYTFDATLADAEKTYESVCNAYDNIFQKIGIATIKAVGDTGTIGGLKSHEYHYITDIGEDTVCICPSCKYSINKAIYNEKHCPQCKNTLFEQCTAEVGHTFLLGVKYTEPLNAMYHSYENEIKPLVMGCFGLGLSRIFTVAVEILSTENELRWPKILAPYTVMVVKKSLHHNMSIT
ncbi:prolyl-tRNA synthetase 2-like protein, mitochondrial isoform X2 [Calliopsis andreniformis]|uniref:prolyl-tRNA synthetase 2-like protein, mitochondrial isoform X2 n=1 Tax=Calliopsis andreniformis TaxID=337506 RepID=UPI003FCEB142